MCVCVCVCVHIYYYVYATIEMLNTYILLYHEYVTIDVGMDVGMQCVYM